VVLTEPKCHTLRVWEAISFVAKDEMVLVTLKAKTIVFESCKCVILSNQMTHRLESARKARKKKTCQMPVPNKKPCQAVSAILSRDTCPWSTLELDLQSN